MGIKKLPYNIECFELDLSGIDLGSQKKSIEYFRKGKAYLPKNLKRLKIDL